MEIRSKFPLEVFRPELREIIKNISNNYQVTEDIVAAYMLCMLGFSMVNKYEIYFDDTWNERSNLWTLIIGDSGSGKSPVLKLLTKPIKKLDVQLHELYNRDLHQHIEYKNALKKDGELHGVQSGDEILKWFHDKFDKNGTGEGVSQPPPMEQPTRLECRIETSTFQKINKLLSTKYNNGRGVLIHYDEFLGFMKSMNQFSKGSDEEDLLKYWEYEGVKVGRVDDENNFLIKDQTISLAATTQSPALFKIVTEDRIHNGLPYRILFEFEESDDKPKLVFDFKNKVKINIDVYYQIIQDFLRGYHLDVMREKLELSDEAKDVLSKWEKHFESKNIYEEYGIEKTEYKALMSKMRKYVGRFVIVVNRQRQYFENGINDLEISGDDMKDAIKIAEHYALNFIRVLTKVSLIKNVYFLNDNESNFIFELPSTFSHKHFIMEYQFQLKRSESTAKRRLNQLIERGIIKKNRRNEYYKTF